ncbi:MAG: Exosome complex component Rrp42 [Candidatus Heimdallarchaeota archaeon LC_3]|nr:MAG: Exosome complex component Rrp42 [Candidatus Heimdallarchaeota archaeon LC_3]
MKTDNLIPSIIESKHTIMLLNRDKRLDGREFFQSRDIFLQTGMLNKAEGSAKVKLGKTLIYAGVKAELGTPFSDTPNEGVLIVNIEMSPIASPYFESGPPSKESIELARVVDRAIREAKVLDTKKLCVIEGEKVWIIFIDIYILGDDGNLIDASCIGAMSALATTKFPKMIPDPEDDKKLIKSDEFLPIPINNWATTSTFSKIGSKIVLDPTLDEEKIENARFTVGVNQNGDITALQKGLIGTFSTEELLGLIDIATDRGTSKIKKLQELIKQGGNWPEDEF